MTKCVRACSKIYRCFQNIDTPERLPQVIDLNDSVEKADLRKDGGPVM
jgi:hypothetical protein